MSSETENVHPTQQKSGKSWLKTVVIVVLACIVSSGLVLWVAHTYLFPGEFKPVTLSASEAEVLETKLEKIESPGRSPALHKNRPQASEKGKKLEPEAYSEDNASREILLTEREVNALLAKNTDLANKLAIDFSDDLASAKLLIPLDEEMPVLGGKTLKVTLGMQLAYTDNKPVVILKGVSIWGVPMPNAWVGNMKNVDLVQEFGDDKGFWSAFAAGIDEIEIIDGQLRVRLKE